ncbi:hypothetical protein [Paraglaciecola sp. 2405UD69-4]|uniref:hypothetical protein n=1 Tax=Paraglaciecola sp. 2405UD69-4 TaxID=3391836 RepID=UPI0039C9B7A6
MFKLASCILGVFALIGLWVIISLGFQSSVSAVISVLLYVLIPGYGAYGIWVKSRNAILITLLCFLWQSIRSVGDASLIPYIAPISMAVPIGDFENGQGYLVDFFALFMVLYLSYLFKLVIRFHK